MKIFLLFFNVFMLMFFLSCSNVSKFEKTTYYYIYDFTKYSERGFLITPEKWIGDYKSIGIIEIEFWPEVSRTKLNLKPGQFYDRGISNRWVYTPINTEEIIESLYKTAIDMGADAIMNFKLSEFIADYGTVTAPGKRVSGFAIKRLK